MHLAERDAVAAVVAAVFPCEGEVREPFPSSLLAERGVLYLATNPNLTPSQFESISRASEAVGDAWFYLSHLYRLDAAQRPPPLSPFTLYDYRLDAHNYEAYLEASPSSGLSHVLASPRGVWGVYVHDNGVVVVAGDREFVSTVFTDQSPAFDQAVLFMRDVLGAKVQRLEIWAVTLLRGVLGSETADEVLSQAAV